MIIIIGGVLVLLGSGYTYMSYMVSKAFEDLGEILANEFGINYLYSLEAHYNNNEEKFNEIDSVAQEMIRSNPKNVLDDSAKQVLRALIIDLFPYWSGDSTFYFYPKLIQLRTERSKHQSDSMKICYWGYVWIAVPFIDNNEIHWGGFNKVDGDYSTEIKILRRHLPKSRGWYFYNEGC